MKIHSALPRLLVGCLLLTGILRAEVTVTSGFDYTNGDYGLPLSTQIITIPFSVSYGVNQTTWELSLPYVRINGPGEVVPGIGRLAGRLLRPKSVNQGVGDLTLGVTRAFPSPPEEPWSFAVGAEVKLGTASAERSLGTGKDDFSTHVDAYFTAGSFTPFFTLGYRWVGNPPGSDLRNCFFGTAGLNWACTEKTTVAALVDWSEKYSVSGSSSVNFTLSVSRTFGEQWQVQLYGVRGNSDNAPDYGGGLSLGRRF